MDRPRVFVVQPVYEEALEELRTVADLEVFPHVDRMMQKDEIIEAVRRNDYLFTLGDTVIDADIINASPDLKIVATMAIYPTTVDIEAATARNIPVTCIPNMVVEATADLAMGLLLAVAWRIPEADAYTRAGEFHQEQSMAFICPQLHHRTLGIVGLGAIGRLIANRARGFDMRILYTKRTRLPANEEAELGVEWRDLDGVMAESDYVMLAPTLTADSMSLIRERELSLMKQSAYLINISRGRVVDEEALIQALEGGRIAGAGLDVFNDEPPISEPNPDPRLLNMPNVVLTPHIGTATRELRIDMARTAADNVMAAIKGERAPNVVNPQVYGDPPPPPAERIG